MAINQTTWWPSIEVNILGLPWSSKESTTFTLIALSSKSNFHYEKQKWKKERIIVIESKRKPSINMSGNMIRIRIRIDTPNSNLKQHFIIDRIVYFYMYSFHISKSRWRNVHCMPIIVLLLVSFIISLFRPRLNLYLFIHLFWSHSFISKKTLDAFTTNCISFI